MLETRKGVDGMGGDEGIKGSNIQGLKNSNLPVSLFEELKLALQKLNLELHRTEKPIQKAMTQIRYQPEDYKLLSSSENNVKRDKHLRPTGLAHSRPLGSQVRSKVGSSLSNCYQLSKSNSICERSSRRRDDGLTGILFDELHKSDIGSPVKVKDIRNIGSFADSIGSDKIYTRIERKKSSQTIPNLGPSTYSFTAARKKNMSLSESNLLKSPEAKTRYKSRRQKCRSGNKSPACTYKKVNRSCVNRKKSVAKDTQSSRARKQEKKMHLKAVAQLEKRKQSSQIKLLKEERDKLKLKLHQAKTKLFEQSKRTKNWEIKAQRLRFRLEQTKEQAKIPHKKLSTQNSQGEKPQLANNKGLHKAKSTLYEKDVVIKKLQQELYQALNQVRTLEASLKCIAEDNSALKNELTRLHRPSKSNIANLSLFSAKSEPLETLTAYKQYHEMKREYIQRYVS